MGVEVEARPLVIVSVRLVGAGGDLALLLLAGVLTFPWARVIVSLVCGSARRLPPGKCTHQGR